MLKKISKKRSISRTYKKFAETHDLVYFGELHDKDHPTVMGATFSTSRMDKHYMHGTVKGFEASVVYRESHFTHASLDTQRHGWTIVQIERLQLAIPYLFINARGCSQQFYQHLHTKFPTLKDATASLRAVNPTFTDMFRVFCKLSDVHFATDFLNDTLMQQLAYYYPLHDVEFDGTNLRIMKQGVALHPRELNDMLQQALWLAELAEYTLQAQKTGVISTPAYAV